MSDQSWNVFGRCPACKAEPGEPCVDRRVRYRRENERAHPNREQLAVPLAIERDPDVPWRYR